MEIQSHSHTMISCCLSHCQPPFASLGSSLGGLATKCARTISWATFSSLHTREPTHSHSSSGTLKLATYKARHGGRGCPLWSAGAHDPETPSGTAGWGSVAGPCWAVLLQEIHKTDRAHQQERAVCEKAASGTSSPQPLSQPEEVLPFPSSGEQAEEGTREKTAQKLRCGLITCNTRKPKNGEFPLGFALRRAPVTSTDTLGGRTSHWNCKGDNLQQLSHYKAFFTGYTCKPVPETQDNLLEPISKDKSKQRNNVKTTNKPIQ